MRRITLGALVLGVVAGSGSVQITPAATHLDVGRCLQLTTTTGLRTSAILNGLELTPDQTREMRSRLASYFSIRGFAGLEGLDLTPEQKQEIQRRIDLQVERMNRYPLGWPCKPFKNPSGVVRFVKAELIANGFRPRMSFTKTSPRQFQFRAIQDGYSFIGVVAKTGPRQIALRLMNLDVPGGGAYRFTLGFEA